MLGALKSSIKRRPRLYDLLNRLRPLNSPTERWLDQDSRALGKGLVFIQIGAADGLRWDPVRPLVVRDAWSGVLVEPIPQVFEMLRRNYAYLAAGRLRFVNAAVGLASGEEKVLWTPSESFLSRLPFEQKLRWLRLSSFSRSDLETHLAAAGIAPEPSLRALRVPCVTVTELAQLLAPRKVDLVVCDAEGYDDEVIHTIDLEMVEPGAIVFESHNLGPRLEDLTKYLEQHGYHVQGLGGDSVATRERLARE